MVDVVPEVTDGLRPKAVLKAEVTQDGDTFTASILGVQATGATEQEARKAVGQAFFDRLNSDSAFSDEFFAQAQNPPAEWTTDLDSAPTYDETTKTTLETAVAAATTGA